MVSLPESSTDGGGLSGVEGAGTCIAAGLDAGLGGGGGTAEEIAPGAGGGCRHWVCGSGWQWRRGTRARKREAVTLSLGPPELDPTDGAPGTLSFRLGLVA